MFHPGRLPCQSLPAGPYPRSKQLNREWKDRSFVVPPKQKNTKKETHPGKESISAGSQPVTKFRSFFVSSSASFLIVLLSCGPWCVWDGTSWAIRQVSLWREGFKEHFLVLLCARGTQNGSIKNVDLLETDFAHQWIVLWIWYSLYYAYLNLSIYPSKFQMVEIAHWFHELHVRFTWILSCWSRRDPKLDPKVVHVLEGNLFGPCKASQPLLHFLVLGLKIQMAYYPVSSHKSFVSNICREGSAPQRVRLEPNA